MNIAAGKDTYQAAVDVNEPDGLFQYVILDNLDQTMFGALQLEEGWHPLASNQLSGAIDYVRSPILKRPLGCLAVFFALLDVLFRSDFPWNDVSGNAAGQALVAMVTGSKKVFAFGAPYTTGLGVHDVHCNQGDPPGEHQKDDGIWQDSCVFALKADGSLSAYLGKFTTQTLDTNDQGLPK